MALTDDQKAMLRLLAQREEGYEDMAALMGISVEEVRGRVKEALSEVDQGKVAAGEPPAPSSPPRPESPAPAAPEPPEPEPVQAPPPPPREPGPPKPAAEEASPAAAAPQPSGKAQAPGAASRTRPSPLSGLKLPKDRGALIGLIAGAAAVLVLVVVLIVGGGGGGSTSTATSTEGGQGSTTAATAKNQNLTQAILAPVDGSEASGVALFGRFRKKVLLQVTAKGLDPSQSGESYAVWLSHSGKAMVPVGTAKVPDSGDLAARFQIPTAVLLLIARGAFDEVAVTRTSDATLSAAIATARKDKKESAYTGAEALRGKITGPFVNAAAKK